VVFDTTPVREISQRSQIPAPPPEEPFEVPAPNAPVLPAGPDSTADRAAAAPDPVIEADPTAGGTPAGAARPASPRAELPGAVKKDSHGLPEQWVLQLGVFSDRANAAELRARAEKAGYHALVQSVDAGGRTQHRVLIEPKIDRSALERLLPEVQRKLGIRAYLTRYYP
jgi:DedD protein